MPSVLQDWSDDRCRAILQNLIPAMRKEYSKVLINENIIPTKSASWQITSLDWCMMALNGNSERMEVQWRELLGSVGLKVGGVWTKEKAAGSLIEAVLDDDDGVEGAAKL